MSSGGLLRKASLRVARPLVRLASLRWLMLPKALATFANPLPYLLRYLEFRAVRRPLRVALRSGLWIEAKTGDDLLCAWDCFVEEEYPVRGDERLIVDCGANIGAFSLYAAGKAPEARVVALEPVSATFAALTSHVEGNRLADRIRCLRLGVAGRSGTVSLSVGGASAFSSMYGPADGPREEVSVLGLPDLLRELGDPAEVDFLKLDCEGAEMDCLLAADAATLRRFRRIGFEYHLASGHAYAEVAGHLRKAGFREEEAKHAPEFGTGIARFARAAGS